MTQPEFFPPEKVIRVAKCLTNVEAIDAALGRLVGILEEQGEEAKAIGDRVGAALPRGLCGIFGDERVGLIMVSAMVNALLYERELLAREVSPLTAVGEAPCAPQSLQSIWEALDGALGR